MSKEALIGEIVEMQEEMCLMAVITIAEHLDGTPPEEQTYTVGDALGLKLRFRTALNELAGL